MYKAILFASDGDYVVDYPCKTKQEVIDKIIDQGSRWIFYPYAFVITNDMPYGRKAFLRKRFVSAPDEMSDWQGATIGTFIKRCEAGDMQINHD